jgi:prepilin-type N-terminal cleavage/methylation domain-containing protein
MEREFTNIREKSSPAVANLRGCDGFSLMEMMVAIGLSAILLMGVTSMNSFTHNSMSNMHAVLYRDEIVKMVQQLSSSPMALKNSLNYSGNTALAGCVNGVAGQCTPGTEYPFTLFDTANSPVTGTAPNPISDVSQPGVPFFYSVLDGSLCRTSTGTPITAATNVCGFEVVTSFIPTCADSGLCQDSKKIALSIQYRVMVTAASGLNPLKGNSLKPVIAPPAPLSYVNALTIQNGYFTN